MSFLLRQRSRELWLCIWHDVGCISTRTSRYVYMTYRVFLCSCQRREEGLMKKAKNYSRLCVLPQAATWGHSSPKIHASRCNHGFLQTEKTGVRLSQEGLWPGGECFIIDWFQRDIFFLYVTFSFNFIGCWSMAWITTEDWIYYLSN